MPPFVRCRTGDRVMRKRGQLDFYGGWGAAVRGGCRDGVVVARGDGLLGSGGVVVCLSWGVRKRASVGRGGYGYQCT